MTFFYDLNKRLANLASKQDQRLAESKEAVATAPKNKLAESIEVAERATGDYSAKKGAAGKDLGKPGKNFAKIAAKSGGGEKGKRIAGAVLNKLRHPKKANEGELGTAIGAGLGGAVGGIPGAALGGIAGHYLSKDKKTTKEGNAFSGAVAKAKADGIQKGEKINVGGKQYPVKETGPMTPKQKSFAKLAPPANKITFADKIAGAKKEVDEMLGDVAAEAIKSAVAKTKEPRSKGTAFDRDFMKQQQTKKDAESHSRYDVKDTGYSKRYTRKVEEPKDDTDAPADKGGTPKKRGRPQGAPKGPERTTKGAWKHKGDRKEKTEEDLDSDGVMMTRPTNCSSEAPGDKSAIKSAIALLKKNGYNVSKKETMGEESTDKEDQHAERAGRKVAKDIEHDEGHKGKDDNRAEKAGKKVTKDIEYDDKKDRKEKKVDETTTSGSVATATSSGKAKGGMQFGKGVYESLDNRFKQALTESIAVQSQMEECDMGGQSITIQADGEDAAKLMALLKLAGLEGCPSCGRAPCGCDQEVVDENSPDWPTNTEKLDAEPNLRTYSGGLNGPKSTGQSTVPVLASQARRQGMEESVELERNLFKTWKNYKG